MDYGHRQEGGIIPNMDISIGFMVFQYKSGDKINNNFFDYIKTCLIFFMIIRKNTPLYEGQRRAFSGQKARQCVPQCIPGGVAVLFTARKHACAPEATPRLNFCLYNLL